MSVMTAAPVSSEVDHTGGVASDTEGVASVLIKYLTVYGLPEPWTQKVV